MDKKVADILFTAGAVRINVEEPFTYASGIKSPIYCDNRIVLGDVEGRNAIIEGFLSIIPEDIEIIAGVATAGIPWGAIIADRRGLPFSYIRSKPKAHGAGRQIEGAEVAGKRVAVIEDLISTGQSSLKAVEVLRREGVASADVYAIFSYQMIKAQENFKAAETELTTISGFSVLLDQLKVAGKLSESEAGAALKWSTDPENWICP